MAITRVVAGLLCLAVASAASPLAPTTLSNLNLRGGGKYFPKMPDSVKPGVVTGQALKDLLATAKEHGYAIPAVNCIGTGSINQVLEAAKKFNCPVMVQFSNGGSQFYAGKSLPNDKDKLQACVLGAVAGAKYVREVAEAYGVPVVLHSVSSIHVRLRCGMPKTDLGHSPTRTIAPRSFSRGSTACSPPTRSTSRSTASPSSGKLSQGFRDIVIHVDVVLAVAPSWGHAAHRATKSSQRRWNAVRRADTSESCSSHMLDLSEEPLNENIEICVKYLKVPIPSIRYPYSTCPMLKQFSAAHGQDQLPARDGARHHRRRGGWREQRGS
eukprot:1699311-Rhodomonas_salina.1